MGNKIIVIGCPGSGKSTFARALGELTGLPVYHLDQLNWNADKTTVPKEVFRQRLQEVLQKDAWIIDGNYGSTIELRLQHCDTVFFLDLPTEVCVEGVRARMGNPRADMPWVETEPDEEFMQFIIHDFPTEKRPQILALRETYGEKEWITFRSRAEADDYLQNNFHKPLDKSHNL